MSNDPDSSTSPLGVESYKRGYTALLKRFLEVPSEATCRRRRRKLIATAPETFKRLLKHAMWPKQIRYWTLDSVDEFTPKRSVSETNRPSSGSYYSTKIHRHVEFESKLELYFFRKLDHATDVVWFLEQPFQIEYVEDRQQQLYVPDALVWLRDNRFLVVDVKPVQEMPNDSNIQKWCALADFCNAYGWGMLITDGRFAASELQKHEPPADFAESLLKALETGPLSWLAYRVIRDEHRATTKDLAAVVFKNELRLSTKPFSLSR